MKTKEQAMQEAFDELMNMPDKYFKERIQEAIDNPGVFGKMALDGFVPSVVNEGITKC